MHKFIRVDLQKKHVLHDAMIEQEIIHEQTRQLEALSRERLTMLYQAMLDKALDYRGSCNAATDTDLRQSLEECEDDDLPISDYEILSRVVQIARIGHERPSLAKVKYEGDPQEIMNLGSSSSSSGVLERAVSVRLDVEDRVAKGLLPIVKVEAILFGSDSSKDDKKVTQTRLRLSIDQNGAVVGDRDHVLSRKFDGDKTIYLASEVINNSDKGEKNNLGEIDLVIDQCLVLVEAEID